MQDIRLAPENPPVSSEDYARREVAGFTVLLNPMVAEQTTLAEQLMESIELQISGLTAQLPASRMTELQKTFIWVELDDEPDKASIYHSSSDWIVASAGNKDKLGHIEIVNAGNLSSGRAIGNPRYYCTSISMPSIIKYWVWHIRR